MDNTGTGSDTGADTPSGEVTKPSQTDNPPPSMKPIIIQPPARKDPEPPRNEAGKKVRSGKGRKEMGK